MATEPPDFDESSHELTESSKENDPSFAELPQLPEPTTPVAPEP